MYPDKKVTSGVPFGPVIPVLAVISILMIAGDMNFVWDAIGLVIASGLYLFSTVINYITQALLTNLSLHTRWNRDGAKLSFAP